MRVVLYADDMEPITVLELSQFVANYIQKHGSVRVPIFEPHRLTPSWLTEPPTMQHKSVTIWAERFIRNGAPHLFMFTKDEEAAMMLRSELLPGQRNDAQERERQRYAAGFLHGLSTLLQ